MGNRPYAWTGEETHKYDDIIALPHPISAKRIPMSASNRAAQFSPFAALVGYDDSISETCRLTRERADMFDDEREQLNLRLMALAEKCRQARQSRHGDSIPYPTVRVVYFLPDEKKDGGSYEEHTEPLKRVDRTARALLFASGKLVPLDDVLEISEMD